jgi:peroxiredoxin
MDPDTTNNQTPLLLALLVGALIACGVGILILLQVRKPSPRQPVPPASVIGQPAPDFTLPNLESQMVSLSAFRGKVILLNIFATWCPPCVEEMPSMQKLYMALNGEDFEILAVSIDTDGARTVAPFMRKHKLNFPALTDTEGVIKRLYRIRGIPESYIIDRSGKVVDKVIGPRDWASPGALRYFRDLLKAR